jgi:hypothetical protein
MIRTYRELQRFHSFEDRFEYLKLGGRVGRDTFGFDRYLNQDFYRSREWKQARNYVIVRDMGCDLGIEGFEIHKGLYVHHMNPMTPDDIKHSNEDILDPDFLICVSLETHNAVHYGDGSFIKQRVYTERRPGDTKLW